MSDEFETQLGFETPLTKIDELREDLFELQIDYIWSSRDSDGYLGLSRIKTEIIETTKELLAAGGKIFIDDNFEFVAKKIDKGFIDQLKSMRNDRKLTEDENTVTLQVMPQPPSASERENKTAKKAGYVQGVCECVAAMFGDKSIGKKLLSEMNVTKEMAKKYANPETYKTLEQGIFAPNQEQRQSLGRGI